MRGSDRLNTGLLRYLTISILIVTMLGLTVVTARAAPRPESVLDQEVGAGTGSGGSHNVVYFSPIGQTFKPSLNRLAYIQVAVRYHPIDDTDPRTVHTLKLKVTDETGQLVVFRIRSFHNVQVPFSYSWLTFDFHDVPVIPGETYALWLEVIHYPGPSLMWEHRGDATAYQNGVPILQGVPITAPGAWDFLFKTYGYSI